MGVDYLDGFTLHIQFDHVKRRHRKYRFKNKRPIYL